MNQSELRAANILTGIVVLVLLIVCANVANLLLSRATARRRRSRCACRWARRGGGLIGQLLVESLVLASIGSALGIAVGYWGKQLLPSTTAQTAPLDWRVLAFVTLITAITGILFGIAPAFRATSGDVNAAF